MKKFIFSGFTDEFAPEFDRQVAAAKDFSMDMIELRFADGVNVGNMMPSQIQCYGEKLREAGIGVSAIGSPLGKVSLDSDLNAHMETARKLFGFANLLGTTNVRIFSFYGHKDTPILESKQEVVDWLGRMLDIADSFGVTLCHENESRIYGELPRQGMELLETFNGRLKCVFDMGNYVLQQVQPWAAYLLQKPYIQYFHIKDALFNGAIVPPGKGEGRIRQILMDFAQTHDAVLVSLEPHLQVFDGLNQLVAEKTFVNLYQYPDQETAFADAVKKLKELILL